jgi:hypothetical protein
MLDKSLRFGFSLFLTAAVPWAYAACSSDETPAPASGPDASMTGSGGSKGTGGKATTGGGGSATSSGGAAPIDVDAAYVCQRQPERDPGGSGAEGSACCLDFGKCTKPSDITDPVLLAAYGHDSCKPGTGDSDLRCTPTASAMADAGSLGVFDTCTTNLGASLEGRCLPKCFIGGNPQASLLKQETCGNAEFVCAPCFNPVDGKPTGACSQKTGDAPTTQPPTPFKTCGSIDGGPALGLCVPKQLALDTGNPAAPSLKQLDCANATDVCAPSLKVKDPNGCFQQCDSFIAGPGGCVAAFLVEAVQPGASANLGQANCQTGELCAPCLNPLSMPVNQPTGACN